MILLSYFKLLFVLFVSGLVFASPLPPYQLPPAAEVIVPLTQNPPATPSLGTKFKLISWNIHKAQAGEAWAEDLFTLSVDADLVLLQEVMNDRFVPLALRQLPHLSFNMAQSYLFQDGSSTGVATGVSTPIASLEAFRSPGREPFTNTPKMSLATKILLIDGSTLLVINVHGINFVSSEVFREQIESLRFLIESHRGKVVFAGDFNTWNAERVSYLNAFAQSLHLSKVEFSVDPRKFIFDRLYLRGCHASKATVLSQIKTSDHFPLKVELTCP